MNVHGLVFPSGRVFRHRLADPQSPNSQSVNADGSALWVLELELEVVELTNSSELRCYHDESIQTIISPSPRLPQIA